ncbi:sigma-E factor regulatory protein RseB domain-containing protein [Spirillospora sp. NPDC029432]|uniref:sigma-E factor regulatory protein RseB domain-containing protein n=1 Tax=Spirillospora sp. NPDC029432 TaxID=3154599 RepID=UPI0034548B8B
MIGRSPARRPGRRRPPRGRLRTMLACGLAAALALGLAPAAESPARRRDAGDPEAERLLRASADAARRVRFEGLQSVTAWTGTAATTRRVRVEHAPGDGTYFTPEPAASGGAAVQAGSRSRSGTYEPDTLPVWSGGVGFTAETLRLLVRNYTLVRRPDGAVCGRTARVVEARRADGSAAGRFWLDAETGLMMRRELLDTGGRRVSATGFTEMRVHDAAAPGPAAAPAARVRAAVPWPDRLDGRDLAALRERGWPVPGALPGRLALYDARRPATGEPGEAVHLSYSDGLTGVSVFVQRGGLDESRMSGWRRTGSRGRTVYRRDALEHWAVWSRDGYVFTVLTDAPGGTADAVAAALPGREGALRARLARGFRRLLSWVDPTG